MGGELRWGERWGRGGSVYVTMGESSSRLDADLPVGCIKPLHPPAPAHNPSRSTAGQPNEFADSPT